MKNFKIISRLKIIFLHLMLVVSQKINAQYLPKINLSIEPGCSVPFLKTARSNENSLRNSYAQFGMNMKFGIRYQPASWGFGLEVFSSDFYRNDKFDVFLANRVKSDHKWRYDDYGHYSWSVFNSYQGLVSYCTYFDAETPIHWQFTAGIGKCIEESNFQSLVSGDEHIGYWNWWIFQHSWKSYDYQMERMGYKVMGVSATAGAKANFRLGDHWLFYLSANLQTAIMKSQTLNFEFRDKIKDTRESLSIKLPAHSINLATLGGGFVFRFLD